MIQLVNTKDLNIICSENPEPYARVIMPCDSPEQIIEKREFPFKLKNEIVMRVDYKGLIYPVIFKQGYIWDGATIPKYIWSFIGSNADPQYLLASMVHDKLCYAKHLIDNNRYLSSIVFKELLLSCKVPKLKANIMFIAVDTYQMLSGHWQIF
jgi:hypothetical protein